MKSILVLTLVSASCFGQTVMDSASLPTDSATGAVQFQQTVVMDQPVDTRYGLKQALSWVSTAYRGANDVVQQYDPERGILAVTGQLPTTTPMAYRFAGKRAEPASVNVYHLLVIEMKPDQCRVTMTNFELEAKGRRVPLQANLGTMTETDYIRMHAEAAGQDKLAIKAAQKNATQAIEENRRYARTLKQQCLAVLDGFKQQMQRKGE
jgi:hypothetical protein